MRRGRRCAAKATWMMAVVVIGLPDAAVLRRGVILVRKHRQPRRSASIAIERADGRVRVAEPRLVVPSLARRAFRPRSPAIADGVLAVLPHVTPQGTVRREGRAFLG